MRTATVVILMLFPVLCPLRADEVPIQSAVIALIDDVEIAAATAGILERLHVREGSVVRQGDLLAEVDGRDAVLKWETVAAELEIARAEAEDLLDIQIAEKALAVASAELLRAEEANRKFSDAVSDSELDTLRYARDQAELKIERARRNVQLARLKVAFKQAELRQSEHEIQRRQIKSPIEGLVVAVERHPGEWVQPGQKMFRVIRTDRLRGEGYVDAKHGDVRPGGVVRVELPGDGEQPRQHSGVVTFVDPEISPINRQFRVWVELENREGHLRPGQRPTMVILRDEASD